MRNVFKNSLFMFILGIIVATCVGVIAVNLNASEIKYKNSTVESALNDLYQKSTYEEYTGTTTVIPSTSKQILLTNDKILKNNITINPVPTFTPASSYTATDTQQVLSTANKMLTGDIVINPVNSLTVVKLGTNNTLDNRTYNLTSYPNYHEFTKDNFWMRNVGVYSADGKVTGNNTQQNEMTYNSETGILTIPKTACYWNTVSKSYQNQYITYDIYLIY